MCVVILHSEHSKSEPNEIIALEKQIRELDPEVKILKQVLTLKTNRVRRTENIKNA
jgi:hypothetical protein